LTESHCAVTSVFVTFGNKIMKRSFRLIIAIYLILILVVVGVLSDTGSKGR
jgi:hypothetical protein